MQRQIRRAFLIHGDVVSATMIYEHAMSWSQRLDGRPLGWNHRWSIVRILETMATVLVAPRPVVSPGSGG